MEPAAKSWLELPSGRSVLIAGSCSIGRALSNQLVLHDDTVSRHHAMIQILENDECWIVDLSSANGTYVNGRRIEQALMLREQDRIMIGHEHITFRSPDARVPGANDLGSVARTVHDVRQVAAWLFLVDIVDSTGIGRRIGPHVMGQMFSEWSRRCREILDASGGIIDKPLGDGFFAFWPTVERTPRDVAGALSLFWRLQRATDLPFRMVLHHGTAFTGGQMASGTYRLFGPEVNFTFRMEGLAKTLTHDCLLSEAAMKNGLGEHVKATPAGAHAVPGLDGSFAFFHL